MARLDAAMAKKIARDLERLTPDTPAKWGKLTAPTMMGHIQVVLMYTMGQLQDLPYKGNLLTRHLFRHLVVNDLVSIPHNVRLPRPADGTPIPAPPITADELNRTIEEYVALVAAGKAPTRLHPFFGPLTPSEWQRFHVAHCKHHLKQFGVWS